MREVEFVRNKKLLNNKTFHQKKLINGVLNFEVHETTCSYILREPNLFLNGESFGQRLFDKIYHTVVRINSVLEIGAGLGHLAKNFIDQYNEVVNEKLNYTILDLSPELIRIQKTNLKNKKVKWIEADALDISKKIKLPQFDVIIANEMLADLPVEAIKNNEIPNGNILNPYQIETIKSFGKGLSSDIYVPTGLIKMLKGLKESCHEETQIILSEYFTGHGGGNLIQLHNHQECRLNLNLTAELIRDLGFDVKVISMIDYLDFNLNVKPISKELIKFFADHLLVLKSRTSPLTEKELKEVNRSNSFELSSAAFCRAEWLTIFSNYYYLIVTPKLNSRNKNEIGLRVYKNEDISNLKIENKYFIVLTHPAKALEVTSEEFKLWKKIKSGNPLKKIIDDNLGNWIFLKKLEANHFINFK